MKVLVIGNGFDLDLGLKTRYSDFAKSKEWDQLYSSNSWSEGSLAMYMKKQADKPNWFDIEQSIADYVKEKESVADFTYVSEDSHYYNQLSLYLDRYFSESFFYWTPNKDSLAGKLIKESNNGKIFDAIYSFNYTSYDLNSSITKYEIDDLYGVRYVHNQGERLIIGVHEDGVNSREYSFVRKVNHSFYSSTDIIPDLNKATQVVIFGHSLNKIDWKYFQDFFTQRSKIISEPKRIITIISKDQSSLMQIKDNLNDFGISITTLSSLCKLVFIGTDNYEFGTYDTKENVRKLFLNLNDGYNSVF